METRASHVVVGSFVLAFLAGILGFGVWIANVDLQAEYTDYDIYFEGSVSGLYKRSIVYYSGIPVGDVRDITLDPNDQQRVKVWVRLRAEIPVTEGARARLEFQGLTGVAYVEIKGGPPGGTQVEPPEEDAHAVIAAEVSSYQAVFDSAPNLLNEAISAIIQIQKLLDDDNIQSVAKILKNADQVTANLARGTTDIDELVAEARAVLVKATIAADNISKLAASGNALLEKDAKQLVQEAVLTLQAATTTINRIDGIVAANGENVTQFISGSLPEVSRMIIDLRATAQSLSRLMNKLEKDPVDLIFGGKESKYNVKTRSTEGEQK